MVSKRWYWVLAFFLLFACSPRTHIAKVDTSYTKITDSLSHKDAAIETYLKPYRTQMESEMNEVVGYTLIEMPKSRPESYLTNLLADIIENQTELLTKEQIDLAIVNFGGIRLPVLPAGTITRGTIFELSPFDNKVIVMKLSKDQMLQMLDAIAASGGWPVSKGLHMVINNKKATDITIDNTPLSVGRKYAVAMPDYIANGGDNFSFLAGIPQEDTGYFLRDMIIDYFKDKQGKNQPVTSIIDHRITEKK